MATSPSKFGFVECADLINEQSYGAALKSFQRAVANFLDSKATPKRSEIARQLLQIGTALEETLKNAYGDNWDTHVPKFADEGNRLACSFCGKEANEVRKLISGTAVHICNECVNLCNDIVSEETDGDLDRTAKSQASAKGAHEERLCGICMESRETDELIFLPHAAYMCAGCLEEIQLVRDRHGDK